MYDVLVVDDEYVVCDNIVRKLKRLTLPLIGKIRVCYSGEEALQLCKESYKPRIVITDIKMGGIDGITLISELRKWLYPVCFLVLSGYDEFEYVRDAFQNGIDDYLLKPILSSELEQAIKKACEKLERVVPNCINSRAELVAVSAVLAELISPSIELQREAELLDYLKGVARNNKCIAVAFGWLSLQNAEIMNERINQICDFIVNFPECVAFPALLSEDRIIILLNFSNDCRNDMQKFIDNIFSRWNETENPVAGAISSEGSIEQCRTLLLNAKSILANRLIQGYGQLYIQQDALKSAGYSELRRQIDMFFQEPEVIRCNKLCFSFSKKIAQLSISEVKNIYQYVQYRISGIEINVSSDIKRLQDFDSFRTLSELEDYLVKQFREIVRLSLRFEEQSVSIAEMAKQYIDNNFEKNISLAELSGQCAVSYTYLSKLLREYLGMSYQEYVQMLRMSKAAKLLHNPKLSIQEIASLVGYENYLNFIRVFKKHYSLTPSQYRISEENQIQSDKTT